MCFIETFVQEYWSIPELYPSGFFKVSTFVLKLFFQAPLSLLLSKNSSRKTKAKTSAIHFLIAFNFATQGKQKTSIYVCVRLYWKTWRAHEHISTFRRTHVYASTYRFAFASTARRSECRIPSWTTWSIPTRSRIDLKLRVFVLGVLDIFVNSKLPCRWNTGWTPPLYLMVGDFSARARRSIYPILYSIYSILLYILYT